MSRDRGSISLWAALAAFCMIVMVGIAVDFGGQAVAEQRARTIAAQAARAAGQELQLDAVTRAGRPVTDTNRAISAATSFLSQAGQNGTASVAGTTITVTVTGSYQCVFLSIIGISSLPVSGTSTAEVVRVYQGSRR
ncbi:MAG: pilus assembly protein TadG-related protein [Propionicimonas sp.]